MFNGSNGGQTADSAPLSTITPAPNPPIPAEVTPPPISSPTLTLPSQVASQPEPSEGIRSAATPSTPTDQLEQSIISYFTPTIRTLLASEPLTLNNLDKNPDFPAYRALFLRFLREGKITQKDEDAYLKTLPLPLDTLGERAVFANFSRTPEEKQIFAIVTGHNSTNWQDTIAADLNYFFATPRHGSADYRTPVGFSELRRRFLTEIKPLASAEQFDAYINAMNQFEQDIYGDRFVHFHTFEQLRKEATALGQDINLSLAVSTAPVSDAPSSPLAQPTSSPTSAQPPSTYLNPTLPPSHLTPLGDEHRTQLISHAVIEGDAWRQGGQNYILAPQSLVAAGLIPKYELALKNRTIYLTDLFHIIDDQLAVLAYVPVVSEVKIRAFYRDKNTALWRYLPDYIRDISGEGIASLGVGFDEHSVTLPIEIQSALATIERNRGLLDLSSTNPNFLFAGTAYAYNTRQEFRDAYAKGQLRGDFYHEVSSTAYNADSGALIAQGRRKNAPQLVSVSAEKSPNFGQITSHYSTYSAFAGQIMAESFWSTNHESQWLFFTDYRGRSWVANIDTTSPITSTGCHSEWLLPTDIATPLYESSFLSDNYGDSNDLRAGSYLSMWNNYLSKIPLINQYSALVAQREQQQTRES